MKIDSDILINALKLENCIKFSSNKISIDSRNIEPNDLFIAINKGHEFVKSALEKGAVAAIIDDPGYIIPEKTILVKNTTEALKAIGKYVQNSVNLKKVIGITGSVGKTTTRCWLSEILNKKFKTFSSIRNYNTIYGLPISLSLLEKGTEFGIFEMGSSNKGEISELSTYLKPDIVILTNIYESHIGKFESQEALVKEKISVLDGLNSNGKLIFDGDSLFRNEIESKANERNIKVISIGFSDNCDFKIISYKSKIKLKTPIGTIEYELSVQGKHFAYISACVIAAIYALDIDIFEFIPYIKNLSQINGRGSWKEYIFKNKTFRIIDDSYNASPSAVLASLDVFKSLQNDRKIAILGQMKELGSYEEHYHKIIAEKLNNMKLYQSVFVGEKSLWPIMSKVKNILCFEKVNDFMIEKILEIVQNNTIVLLKGSRSIELNKFIDYIKCSIT